MHPFRLHFRYKIQIVYYMYYIDQQVLEASDGNKIENVTGFYSFVCCFFLMLHLPVWIHGKSFLLFSHNSSSAWLLNFISNGFSNRSVCIVYLYKYSLNRFHHSSCHISIMHLSIFRLRVWKKSFRNMYRFMKWLIAWLTRKWATKQFIMKEAAIVAAAITQRKIYLWIALSE